MEQIIYKSKWDDDEDQLPPLVEEVEDPNFQGIMQQGQDNDDQIFLINLNYIGYEGTTAIVCKSNKTIEELKQMIYTKHQKEIKKPEQWIIKDHLKEYQNNQQLKEIDISCYNQLKADLKYSSDQNIKTFEYTFNPNLIIIILKHEQRLKHYNITIDINSKVKELIKEFNRILEPSPHERIILQQEYRVLNPNQTFREQMIVKGSIINLRIEGSGGCFPGYAPVTLKDGSIKQIKDIQINDEVQSYDIDSKQFISSKIIATHNSEVDQLIEIQTIQSLITTTSNHPFFTEDGWKAVQPHPSFQIQNLTIADKILNISKQFEQILSIQYQNLKERQTVYNITTRTPNNYIVYGYVVHNMTKINIRINGKIEELEIFPDMLVSEVKILIAQKYGLDLFRLKLLLSSEYHKQQELEDLQTISSYLNEKIIGVIDIIINYAESPRNIQSYSKYSQDKNHVIQTEIVQIIEFTIQMKQKEVVKLEELQIFFEEQRENLPSLRLFIIYQIDLIKQNPQKMEKFQRFSIDQIIAIKIWSSSLIYKQLNIDLKMKNYDHWKLYLKLLIEALKLCTYYNGSTFRGLKNYQNRQLYQMGKTIQFSEVIAMSKSFTVAKRFSNATGMILQFYQRSSKEIEQLSLFPNEQEVILLPFSQFIVKEIRQVPKEPMHVILKELPQPRWFKVLLWIEDRPENCYPYAQEIEKKKKDISVVFCISTEEAIKTIERNAWIYFLEKQNFRIVTDMTRVENGILNETAGVDFIQYMYEVAKIQNDIFVFCRDTQKAKLACKNKNLIGNYIISNKSSDLMNFLNFQ